MRKYILCASMISVFLFTAVQIEAVGSTVFEKTYVRGTGKPITETDTFTGNEGIATIKVNNGGLEDTDAEMVSSAVITLNGTVIIDESDFNQNVDVIEVENDLSEGNNTIEVTLNGKPGGTLTVQVLSENSVVLPPDPGEEGNQTLLGIDTDGDGARDDIQRYIYLTYPDDEKLQLGLMYYAIEFQGVLVDADDREAAYDHAIKMSRHGECIYYLKGRESINIRRALRAEILNTRERSIAYITYNDNLGGTVIRRTPFKEWKNSCAFDVDAIGDDQ